jgi:hypothetical protein
MELIGTRLQETVEGPCLYVWCGASGAFTSVASIVNVWATSSLFVTTLDDARLTM